MHTQDWHQGVQEYSSRIPRPWGGRERRMLTTHKENGCEFGSAVLLGFWGGSYEACAYCINHSPYLKSVSMSDLVVGGKQHNVTSILFEYLRICPGRYRQFLPCLLVS